MAGQTLPDTYTTISSILTDTSVTNAVDTDEYKTATIMVNVSSSNSFNFEFVSTDKLNNTTVTKVSIGQGIPLMSQMEDGHVTVGCVPDFDNNSLFQVGSDIMATDSDGTKVNILGKINNVTSDIETINEDINMINNNLYKSYSLEEIKTNEAWIDRKPIYRKTVYIPALPSAAGNKSYPHNITNLDNIINMEGIGYATTSTLGTTQVLNYAITSTTSTNAYIVMQANNSNIIIYVGQDRSSWKAYITLYYTKTTD